MSAAAMSSSPKDLTPLSKALIAGEDGGGMFVAPAHELEEEHRAIARDWQIADLVDDHETREDERPEARQQATRFLRVFERVQRSASVLK